jgi:hypothetical protein
LRMAGEWIELPSGKISKKAALKESMRVARAAGFEIVDAGGTSRFTSVMQRDTIAEFDQTNTTIFLNSGHPYWKNVVGYSQIRFDLGKWSTNHPHHVIFHEVGHAKHLLVSPQKFSQYRFSFPVGMPDELKSISARAQSEGPLGWVAEVYAMLSASIVVPDDILVWYNKLGGPLPGGLKP